ncbi:MAG: hypothetical protein U0929_02990 [Planctomycetaceae bacterium]
MRWLWSPKAIQCHIAFWLVGGIFFSLLFGSKEELQKYLPGNDWIWLLLFLVFGYPLVLFLLWSENRSMVKHIEREAIEIQNNPEKVRVRRARWRRGSLVLFAIAGGAAIYFGNVGLLVNGLPAQYLGYFILSMATLGLCGVNIWYGGPIDPRFDPQDENLTET